MERLFTITPLDSTTAAALQRCCPVPEKEEGDRPSAAAAVHHPRTQRLSIRPFRGTTTAASTDGASSSYCPHLASPHLFFELHVDRNSPTAKGRGQPTPTTLTTSEGGDHSELVCYLLNSTVLRNAQTSTGASIAAPPSDTVVVILTEEEEPQQSTTANGRTKGDGSHPTRGAVAAEGRPSRRMSGCTLQELPRDSPQYVASTSLKALMDYVELVERDPSLQPQEECGTTRRSDDCTTFSPESNEATETAHLPQQRNRYELQQQPPQQQQQQQQCRTMRSIHQLAVMFQVEDQAHLLQERRKKRRALKRMRGQEERPHKNYGDDDEDDGDDEEFIKKGGVSTTNRMIAAAEDEQYEYYFFE